MLAAEENGMRGRRDILTGLAASLAGMPLTAILADPVLARAAARELERVTLHLDSGREVGPSWRYPTKRRRPPST